MMESIKCFFSSPSKEKIDEKFKELPCIVVDNYDESAKLSLNMIPPNGKTIVCNMESVINSVKQRRKKNKKKNKKSDTIPESEIADISDILSNNLKFVSPNVSLENNYEVEILNGELDKTDNKCSDSIEICNTPKKCSESKNAFTLMMDARNKSIGTNSPGKEISPDSKLLVLEGKNKNRKLQLEAWAIKKGALKRKELDVAHEECIRQKMEDRKNRLKKLIKNDSDDEIKPNGKVKKTKKLQKYKKSPVTEPENLTSEKKISTKRNSKYKVNNKSEDENVIIDEETSRKSHKRKRSSKLSPEERCETSSSSPKRKIQRLLPTDSLENKNTKAKVNILEILTSPTKKRDSLLGYFNVLDKTSSENKENGTEGHLLTNKNVCAENNSKEKQKINNKCSNTANLEIGVEKNSNKPEEKLCTTPSGRPKRLCTEKTKKYDIDIEISPKKSNTKVKKSNNRCCSPTVTPLKIINLQSPLPLRVVKSPGLRRLSETIDLAYLSDSNDSVKKPKKVAPIFMKANVIDPDILKARQNFLMSGIPEKLRIEIEKQKVYEESFELDLFPTITHITQLNETDLSNINTKYSQTKIKIKDEDADILSVKNKVIFNKELKKILEISHAVVDKNNQCKIRIPDMKDCKKMVQKQTNMQIKFPIIRCFKQLREKILYTNNDHPNDSNVNICLDNSIEVIEENFSSINGDLLFCNKYKPNNINEFLVNSTPVQLLKKFLLSWKNEESPKETFYDSSDDFQNKSCSNLSCDIINYIVLIGPPGCGKTNSVYALANELNFKVLEINAGSKRTGKKILQELQEATQSHNVRTKDEKIKKNRKLLNGKKIFIQNNGEDSESENSTIRKSLILIDDADIIFDQDDGFINAINQLVSSSKRPVILITNTDKCPHLTKYIAHSSIRYSYANIDKISQWLSMLCLVEKTYISSEDIRLLYIKNKCDARKTINELQFFIQSGGDRNETSCKAVTSHNNYLILSNKNSFNLNNNNNEKLNDDSNCISTDCKKVKSKKNNNIYQHKLLLNVFPDTIDMNNLKFNIPKILKLTMNSETKDKSKMNKLRKSKSPIKMKKQNMQQMALDNQINFYENLSRTFYLKKNSYEDDYLNYNLHDEIFTEVLRLTIKCDDDTAIPMINYTNSNSLDWTPKQSVTSRLHFNIPSKYIQNNINLDYEPCLRSICRSEQQRCNTDRRASRFYHYLRNMTSINSFNLNEFDTFCNYFTE